jgi:hypothetical protein
MTISNPNRATAAEGRIEKKRSRCYLFHHQILALFTYTPDALAPTAASPAG